MAGAVEFGINLLENEIDDVIFQTNEFLTNSTFYGSQGPFWFILQMSMALAALFAVIMATNMGYKMMIKKEPLDVMKLFRPLAIAIVLSWWYPNNSSWCVLDFLSYIPNAIGSYTCALYEAEASQVQSIFENTQDLIAVRDSLYTAVTAPIQVGDEGAAQASQSSSVFNSQAIEELFSSLTANKEQVITSTTAGLMIFVDKLIMVIALITYRVGWWGTIYCQQILLGMLTIFGPIQWAFSLLPKWEGAWAKWTIRYLTVHFYGAMLYFVGFYVLLLFDIVLNIQYNDLAAITVNEQATVQYLKNCFFSAGYMMAASVVALKCLTLVPDLAAWMIPEGETTYSARSFGQGVSEQVKGNIDKAVGSIIGKI